MSKRSSTITLGSITALSALVIAACGAEEVTADCVDTTTRADDGSYQPANEQYCDGGSHPSYVWMYGGDSSGGRIRGGSTIRPGDVKITSRTGRVIVRGGFGGRAGDGGG